MAAAVTYSNFGGMVVHENRGGKETFYGLGNLGSSVVTHDACQDVTNVQEWRYVSAGTNPSPGNFESLLGYPPNPSDSLTTMVWDGNDFVEER